RMSAGRGVWVRSDSTAGPLETIMNLPRLVFSSPTISPDPSEIFVPKPDEVLGDRPEGQTREYSLSIWKVAVASGPSESPNCCDLDFEFTGNERSSFGGLIGPSRGFGFER